MPAAVHHLAGLNAQAPNLPYLSLFSRLGDFRQPDLTEWLLDRRVVRSTLFRGTQHLLTGTDFRWLRPVVQPLLTRIQRNTFGRRTAGVDLDELVQTARTLLRGQPRTRPELGRLLARRWPGLDRSALAWSVQYLEPILHPAPSGTWNTRGPTPYQLAADVLGPVDPAPAPTELVRCCLAAFGPATVADIRSWSGVSGLREVVAGMTSELLTFTDDAGRHLIDLPDAPRPDPDVPAPVRFLPEFDNLMLAHTHSRVMTDEERRGICVDAHVPATLLLDGMVGATWALERRGDTALLSVQPLQHLTRTNRAAITDEGARLLDFATADADARDLRILTPH